MSSKRIPPPPAPAKSVFDPFAPTPEYLPESRSAFASDTRFAPGNITRRLERRNTMTTRQLMAAPRGTK